MSNTINVRVTTPGEWTEVLTASTEPYGGVFSMAKSGQHCISVGLPDSGLIGHRYVNDTYVTLDVGESLYVKADTNTFFIFTRG